MAERRAGTSREAECTCAPGPHQMSELQVPGKGVRATACGTSGWKPQNTLVREACGVWARGGVSTGLRVK